MAGEKNIGTQSETNKSTSHIAGTQTAMKAVEPVPTESSPP